MELARGFPKRGLIKEIISSMTFLVSALSLILLWPGYVDCQIGSKKPLQFGKQDAGAQIEVFYDLQCGACAIFHPILKKVEDRFAERVLVTFRHFPLDIPAHDKAFLAARMVESARLQGKGLEMLDLILLNQPNWATSKRARETFFRYAATLKVDLKQFREDFESDKVIRAVMHDIERAKSLKLDSVPSVFVNGEQITLAEAYGLGTIIEKIVK